VNPPETRLVLPPARRYDATAAKLYCAPRSP